MNEKVIRCTCSCARERNEKVQHIDFVTVQRRSCQVSVCSGEHEHIGFQDAFLV